VSRVSIEIEVANPETVTDSLPLLRVQFDEHQIAIDQHALDRAVRGLVEVEGRGRMLLAREGTTAIGVAVMAYTWTLEHGGRVAWLEELYVVPERRVAGIGTKLLHRAMEVARADGCLAMDLEVDADHVRAEGLYVREGFRPLPRRRFAKKL
jgi:GNAT superfamily N-acetyltransferase